MSEIKVDFQQFERQRLTIGKLYGTCEHITEIIHLLDAISDEYQLSGGEPVVIYPTHQYPNEDTIQIMHEHDYDRCIPLMNHRWDCSDFLEEKVNV